MGVAYSWGGGVYNDQPAQLNTIPICIPPRDELQKMLAEDELREAVLLVFANKQDLRGRPL